MSVSFIRGAHAVFQVVAVDVINRARVPPYSGIFTKPDAFSLPRQTTLTVLDDSIST
jgi:hypothetical protein